MSSALHNADYTRLADKAFCTQLAYTFFLDFLNASSTMVDMPSSLDVLDGQQHFQFSKFLNQFGNCFMRDVWAEWMSLTDFLYNLAIAS
jgi:hypothetical protein